MIQHTNVTDVLLLPGNIESVLEQMRTGDVKKPHEDAVAKMEASASTESAR